MHSYTIQGRSQDFFSTENGVGVLGEGASSPLPTSYEILGSAVSSLSGVLGIALAVKRFSRVLSVQSDLSGQSSVVYCSFFMLIIQGKIHEKLPRRLPRSPQWTLQH